MWPRMDCSPQSYLNIYTDRHVLVHAISVTPYSQPYQLSYQLSYQILIPAKIFDVRFCSSRHSWVFFNIMLANNIQVNTRQKVCMHWTHLLLETKHFFFFKYFISRSTKQRIKVVSAYAVVEVVLLGLFYTRYCLHIN